MLKEGKYKKSRKNPNDPARFIGKEAVTKDGEIADILYFLDETKIADEDNPEEKQRQVSIVSEPFRPKREPVP